MAAYQLRELGGVFCKESLPFLLALSTADLVGVKKLADVIIDMEALCGVKSEEGLHFGQDLRAQGGAMNLLGALELGSKPNDRRDLDQAGLVLNLNGLINGILEAKQIVVTILDVAGVPAVSLKPLQDIFTEGEVGAAIDLDVVVIVEHDQLAKTKVASERGGLSGHSLLEAAVTDNTEGVVVDDLKPRLVEIGGEVLLSHGQSNSVGDAWNEKMTGKDREKLFLISHPNHPR